MQWHLSEAKSLIFYKDLRERPNALTDDPDHWACAHELSELLTLGARKLYTLSYPGRPSARGSLSAGDANDQGKTSGAC